MGRRLTQSNLTLSTLPIRLSHRDTPLFFTVPIHIWRTTAEARVGKVTTKGAHLGPKVVS
jgi:hypothetical protein